jgi:hypothetical protein
VGAAACAYTCVGPPQLGRQAEGPGRQNTSENHKGGQPLASHLADNNGCCPCMQQQHAATQHCLSDVRKDPKQPKTAPMTGAQCITRTNIIVSIYPSK